MRKIAVIGTGDLGLVKANKDINECIRIIRDLKYNQIRYYGQFKAIDYTIWKSRLLYLKTMLFVQKNII